MSKLALVTGSSRGIGKAIVTEFARKGYDVVINYIHSENEAQQLKIELEEKYHINAYTIKADITDENAVKSMANVLSTRGGGRRFSKQCWNRH